MPRGGKTNPSPRTPPGGPGKYSRRTDGQHVATPGIGGPGPGGESSLQFGDVQRLEGAQRAAPLPVGTPPPKTGGARGAIPPGTPPGGGRIPAFLTEMDPEVQEPTTTGLNMGPGPGSEVLDLPSSPPSLAEATLMMLASQFGDEDAARQLRELQAARVQPQLPTAPVAGPEPPPGAPVPG